MKKLINLIVLFILIVSGNSFGQSTWENVPQAVQFSPTDFEFTDLNNGWATTILGGIAHTNDGGDTWTLTEAFIPNAVYGIDMISATHGYAGGPNVMLETTDGEHWDTIISDPSTQFAELEFLNDTLGIAYALGSAGEIILKTTDGGQSWDTIWVELNFVINSFQFVNDSTIVIVGPDLNPSMNFAISHDGGETWNQSQIAGMDILDVAFTSNLEGHLTAQNGVYMKTENGGISWQTSTYDPIWYPYPTIYFQSETLGFIGMQNGGLLRTSDGGENWTEVLPPSYRNFSKIHFIDALHGWAASSILTEIIATSDGGLTWTSIYSGSGWPLTDITFHTDMEGWASGLSGTVLHTTDGGDTWSLIESPLQYHYYKVEVTDYQSVWALSDDWIFYTLDNGVNWNANQFSGSSIQDLDFPTSDTGYIAGGYSLYKTLDGGYNWGICFQQLGYSFRNVSFITANTGLASNQGTVFRTYDGGETWETITPSGITGYLAMDYPVQDTAYIVGYAGLIIATYDGGNTWVEQSSGTTSDLTDVSFSSSMNGWASGNDGTILITLDGGQTWLPQSTPTSTLISAVAATPGNDKWATKTDGNFLKFSCASVDVAEVNTYTLAPAGSCDGSVMLSSDEAFVTDISGQNEVISSSADFSNFCEGVYSVSGYNSCSNDLNETFVIPEPDHFFGAVSFTDSAIAAYSGNVQELCGQELSSVSSARLISASYINPSTIQAGWEITTGSGIVQIPATYNGLNNGVVSIQLSLYCEEDGFEGVVINENIIVQENNILLNNKDLQTVNLELFPNPASSEIIIRFEDEIANLIIRDINGKQLLSKEVLSNDRIDLSGFANGIYLFEISTEKGIAVKRVLKN